MQKVYDSFSWIDRAHSVHIIIEQKTAWSPEQIKADAETPIRNPISGKLDPRPIHATDEWAWDETHVRHQTSFHHEGETSVSYQTEIWDGKKWLTCMAFSDKGDTQYCFGKKLDAIFNDQDPGYMTYQSWGLGWGHHFWWLPIDVKKQRTVRFVLPEDFEMAGQESFNGRPCYVIQTRPGHYRLDVGVADGQLYRLTEMMIEPTDPAYNLQAIYKKIGHPEFKMQIDWQKWYDKLSPDKQSLAWREFYIAEFDFERPTEEVCFDDYREVAPGCWMPFRQSVNKDTQFTVTEASVDKPVNDELFHIELHDGVNVASDSRYDPIIHYKYSKDQTEEERLALCEATKIQFAKATETMEKLKLVIQSRIGHAPRPPCRRRVGSTEAPSLGINCAAKWLCSTFGM